VQKLARGAAAEWGRPRPVVIPDSEYVIEVDTVVVGVGTDPNPLIPRSIQGLDVSKWGTIVVDENTMQTNIPEIFAGGDIVRGGATVILAMGDGKKAAESMHLYLQNKKNL
jgi:glutamate synthase (NADPH/NADH) small chain